MEIIVHNSYTMGLKCHDPIKKFVSLRKRTKERTTMRFVRQQKCTYKMDIYIKIDVHLTMRFLVHKYHEFIASLK